jgi:hypothetical protein
MICKGTLTMKIDQCPLTADEKRRMIAEAAYYCYEKRGRTGGDSTEDWLEAEAEIEKHINEFCAAKPRKPGFAAYQKMHWEPRKIFTNSGQKARDAGESIPKTIKKAGKIARQELSATGEKLGHKLADFRVKRSELANIWSGKGACLLHQASQTIKGWINRQHGNGK